ncbi:hypothetical protein KLP40_18050 [Hymenobacter sp. NST-14]|uniref:hypothetical protein n=1 Tax=Hymenobacter piscis TaxID=2839984 RepID=UPI001C032E66|nr:hypothetical protein [Hymenobacter piscis]MBT9395075.1 hypothetical protein [Hymenobacter piscis]
MNKIILTCFAFIFLTNEICAQNKTVKGILVDESLAPLSYSFILINDTVEIGKTDLNGNFKVEIPIYTKNIWFKAVGFETALVELMDNCNYIELIMISSSSYDFFSPKKVKKIISKKFNKLPELHKQACSSGVFKENTICYTVTPVLYYRK